MADPVATPAPVAPRKVAIVSPEGGTYLVPETDAGEAIRRGARLETPEEARAREMEAKHGEEWLRTGIEGVLSGATGGLSNVALAMGGQAQEAAERRETFPVLSPGAEIAGGLLGLGKGMGAAKSVAGKGLAALTTPARLTIRAGQVVERGAERLLAPLAARGTLGRVAAKGLSVGAGAGTEGAIVGAQQWLSESALGETEPTASALIDRIGAGALLGGVFGGGLGAGGALVKAGGEKITREVRDWMAERWAGGGGPLGDVFSEAAGVVSGAGAKPIRRFMRSAEERQAAVNAPKILDGLAIEGADAQNAMLQARDKITTRGVGRFKDADVEKMTVEAAPDFREKSIALIDDQIAEVDEMLAAGPGDYGHRPDLKAYKTKLSSIRKKAEDGESAGAIYNEIDSAKQDLGKIRKRELHRRDAPSADQATTLRLRKLYDGEPIEGGTVGGLKNHLEDDAIWGKTVTAAQREENAAWHWDLADVKRRPGAQMTEAWEGAEFWDSGKLTRQARTKGIRDYFENLGKLETREDTPMILAQLKKDEALLDTIAKHRSLDESELAALAEYKAASKMFLSVHDRALKTAGSRNVLTEMEAAEGRLGIGAVGGTALGAVAFGPVGAAVGALAGAMSKPSRVIRTMAVLDRLLGEQRTAIVQGVGSYVRKATGSAKKVTRHAIPQAVTRVKAAEGRQKRVDAYREKLGKLSSLAADPVGAVDQLNESARHIQEGAPRLSQAVQQKAVQTAAYLHARMPKPMRPPAPFSRSDGWAPSESEIDRYEAIEKVALKPSALMDSLQDGTLTGEQVDAVRELHPHVYQQIVSELTDRLSELQDDLPYEERIRLTVLFGVPIEPAASPEMLATWQATHAAQRAQTEQAAQRPPTEATSRSIEKVSKASMTATQRLEAKA
jgi:hypothetical protein